MDISNNELVYTLLLFFRVHFYKYTYLLFGVFQLMVRFAWTVLKVLPSMASNLRERFCPIRLNRPPRQSAKDSGIYSQYISVSIIICYITQLYYVCYVCGWDFE